MREGTNDLYEAPTRDGHFGRYGGRFVAETLFHALDQLDALYQELKEDPDFRRELAQDLSQYVGRPTPLYAAERLTRELGGAQIFLKREDLNHTGAHKINNTVGQALLAQRMGKRRIIAETGAGQHGVATATVCGAVRAGVRGLHGRGGHPPPESQRLPDATVGRGGGAGHVGFAHAQGRDQ